MKLTRRILLATSLAASLAAFLVAFDAFAEVPVVDESDNFASVHFDEETPLAHEESITAHNIRSNTELLNKIQGLQQDIQELRGQLELQTHDLKILQQQQVDFYKDLDSRIHNKSEATTPSPNAATLDVDTTAQPAAKPEPIATHRARTNPADEQINYLAAYELINNKHFEEALPAMQAFVSKYPQGGYTANAHYWIGELYMVKKNYQEAIKHFEVVLQQFPSSSKTSASMLKIGYALSAAGELSAARQRLQSVVKQYPDTHAAQLALAKLESIPN